MHCLGCWQGSPEGLIDPFGDPTLELGERHEAKNKVNRHREGKLTAASAHGLVANVPTTLAHLGQFVSESKLSGMSSPLIVTGAPQFLHGAPGLGVHTGQGLQVPPLQGAHRGAPEHAGCGADLCTSFSSAGVAADAAKRDP